MIALIKRLICIYAFIITAQPATSQGLFDAVIRVDDAVITQFELTQRAQLLEVLGASGDLAERARTELVNDRLKQQVFGRFGVTISDADLLPELEQFAARGNMDLATFQQMLATNGVAVETFHDFVRTNVLWRDVIRAKFGAQAEPSDADINRAISTNSGGGTLDVQLAEIILAYSPGQETVAKNVIQGVINTPTRENFSRVAQQYSASPSRANGGVLDFTPTSQLPPALQSGLTGAKPGDIIGPFEVEGAYILFQLRDLTEGAYQSPAVASVEH